MCDGTGGGLAKKVDAVNPADGAGVYEGPGVRWVFAGPGKDADSLIERILEGLERRGRASGLKVVSNDKRVRAAAVGVRAKRVDARAFVRSLVSDNAKRSGKARGGDSRESRDTGGLDAESAKAWIRVFGLAADGEPAGPAEDGGKDWAAEIDLDDLDTGRWVDGVERKPPGNR